MTSSSENLAFGIIDYILFAILLIISSCVGIYFGFIAKSKNTPEEYLLGGKKMKIIPIAMSLVASQLSAIAVVAVPAETYTFGYQFFYHAFAMILALPILAFIITPIFYENDLNNCYEYLHRRFNKATQKLVTICFILSTMVIMPVFMYLPSLAFSQVTGFNLHLINIVVTSICVIYTMWGGIKAVVWIDLIQGSIMFATGFAVAIIGIIKTGGFTKVIEYATVGGRLDANLSFDPFQRITVWNAFISGMILWTAIGVSQSDAQRIVSLPTLRHSQWSLLLGGIGVLLLLGCEAFLGVIMYAYYHDCDPLLTGQVDEPNKLILLFVQEIIGHIKGIPGIFISCIFSASLSSVSTCLNSLAGLIYFDYVKPFIQHTDAKANFIMKLIVVILGVYCIAGGIVVQKFDSIIQLVTTFLGMLKGAIVGIFLLGMLVPRVNGKVALTSFIITNLIMAWFAINNQIRLSKGLLVYEKLPGSTVGCDALNFSNFFENSTSIKEMNVMSSPLIKQQEEFSIYDISFYWYYPLGVILVWLIGIPLSLFWKHKETETTNDLKLYAPCVQKFIKRRKI